MAIPLAPIVHGPIVPSSTHVAVSGALLGATIQVVTVGINEVGRATAGANGNLLVPLHRTLVPGELVFARQTAGL